MTTDSTDSQAEAGDEQVLALVRYGLGKEIRLFPTRIAFISREEGDDDRFELSKIRALGLQPGEHIPSKLIVLLEFLDGTSIIVGEGMTNVRDFTHLLSVLSEVAPQIALDPPDMAEQLRQAVVNRRQSNLGCYVAVLVSALVLAAICALGNLLIHLR